MNIQGNFVLPRNPFSAVFPKKLSPTLDFLAGRFEKSTGDSEKIADNISLIPVPSVEVSLMSVYLAYRIYQVIFNPSSQVFDLSQVTKGALIEKAPTLWEISKMGAGFAYNTGCLFVPDTCNSIESWANWTVDAIKIGTPAVAAGIVSSQMPPSIPKSLIYATVAIMNVAMLSMGVFNPFR